MIVDAVDRPRARDRPLRRAGRPDRAGARRLPFLGPRARRPRAARRRPDTGAAARDREVGELEVRGASVTPGYFRNPDATAASFHDDWLRTGDLGYLVDGELVDLRPAQGRDHRRRSQRVPRGHRARRGGVDGVRAGNVIAFGTPGRRAASRSSSSPRPRPTTTAPRRCAAAVAERVTDAIGIPPSEIVLVAPGTLPKTSSGKLQRSLCKDRYLSDRSTVAERACADQRPGDGVVALVGLG